MTRETSGQIREYDLTRAQAVQLIALTAHRRKLVAQAVLRVNSAPEGAITVRITPHSGGRQLWVEVWERKESGKSEFVVGLKPRQAQIWLRLKGIL